MCKMLITIKKHWYNLSAYDLFERKCYTIFSILFVTVRSQILLHGNTHNLIYKIHFIWNYIHFCLHTVYKTTLLFYFPCDTYTLSSIWWNYTKFNYQNTFSISKHGDWIMVYVLQEEILRYCFPWIIERDFPTYYE